MIDRNLERPASKAPLIERVFIGALGLLLAIPAGFVVLVMGFLFSPHLTDVVDRLANAAVDSGLFDSADGLTWYAIAAVFAAYTKAATLLAVIPPTLTALLGEGLRFRSFAWYAGASGSLGAALPYLIDPRVLQCCGDILLVNGHLLAVTFSAGGVSGTIYWLVAGKNTGAIAQ